MKNKIYKNFIITTISLVLVTSFFLSLLFYDLYRTTREENLTNYRDFLLNKPVDIELVISESPLENSLSHQLDNGKYLNLSQENKSFFYVFVSSLPVIVGILVFLLIILYLVSSKLTEGIIEPIKMASNEDFTLDTSYRELDPLLKTFHIKNQEFENSIKELEDNESFRKEFTSNVSHELKTPLTSIIGFAELMELGNTSKEDVLHFSRVIREEGERLLRLIDSILKINSLDERRQVDMEKISLYKLAEEVVFKLGEKANEKKIDLSLQGDKGLIIGNSQMVLDLIYNLVSNGIKYNKEGGSLRLEITSEDDYMVLLVEDTGIGIPEEDLANIFERFYMVDKSRSKKVSGTGLGLSIVKNIVKIHQGHILVKSQEGQGTSFIVYMKKAT